MIIVLLLLFHSLCVYCQRIVLYIHDRCFPRNVRLLQEVAETVGDRKAPQRLAEQQLEQQKRSQKRRILEPILPLVGGANSEACRFCAHSPHNGPILKIVGIIMYQINKNIKQTFTRDFDRLGLIL